LSHYVLHGKTIAETVKQLLTKVKLQLNSEDLSSLYLDALKRVRPTCRISSTSQRESILFLVVDLILYVDAIRTFGSACSQLGSEAVSFLTKVLSLSHWFTNYVL
jgi:hypothetical protein